MVLTFRDRWNARMEGARHGGAPDRTTELGRMAPCERGQREHKQSPSHRSLPRRQRARRERVAIARCEKSPFAATIHLNRRRAKETPSAGVTLLCFGAFSLMVYYYRPLQNRKKGLVIFV